MRQHLAWPHFHLPSAAPEADRVPSRSKPSTTPVEPRASPNPERWQTLRDRLAVAAVLVLVLATITVFVLYVVQQAPHFGSGELTGFATPAPGIVQQAEAAPADQQAAPGVAGSGLGRIPLILISTIVEMGIFVALGLYLRHDMKRNP